MLTVFIIIYLAALGCYLFSRNGESKLLRALNKYLMAGMYLGLSIYVFFKKYDFVSYQTLLQVALFLAFLGDVFLVFDFGRGGDFFLSGNVCFIVYEQIVLVANGYKLKDFFWIYIVAGLMLTAFILACQYKPDVFKLGKMRWPMTFYLSSIMTHGISGLALVLMLPGTNFVMMGIGSLLFMISDLILTSYKFVFNNNIWLIRANSITYFIGMLLIVLATI
ncbi:MAG: hypothetical protein J6S49_06770 [Erysipelotrichaceae bacterium]|nr:hypothetical protein [Erysipelotrichaceae bacterium]